MPREAGAENLKVTRGQQVLAEHHNGLVRLAERLTINRGALKGTQGPDGFTARLDVRQSTNAQHAWKALLEEEDKLWLRFLVPSFVSDSVSGVMPELNGTALDDVDENGESPRLEIPEDAFAKKGRSERALILMRYELRTEDFSVQKAVPIASAQPLGVQPWQWHKLIGIVVRQDGAVKYWPQAFFPLAFDVSGADKKTGRFKPWPRIA